MSQIRQYTPPSAPPRRSVSPWVLLGIGGCLLPLGLLGGCLALTVASMLHGGQVITDNKGKITITRGGGSVISQTVSETQDKVAGTPQAKHALALAQADKQVAAALGPPFALYGPATVDQVTTSEGSTGSLKYVIKGRKGSGTLEAHFAGKTESTTEFTSVQVTCNDHVFVVVKRGDSVPDTAETTSK